MNSLPVSWKAFRALSAKDGPCCVELFNCQSITPFFSGRSMMSLLQRSSTRIASSATPRSSRRPRSRLPRSSRLLRSSVLWSNLIKSWSLWLIMQRTMIGRRNSETKSDSEWMSSFLTLLKGNVSSWADYRGHHDHPVYHDHDDSEDKIWSTINDQWSLPEHSLTRPVMPTTTVTKSKSISNLIQTLLTLLLSPRINSYKILMKVGQREVTVKLLMKDDQREVTVKYGGKSGQWVRFIGGTDIWNF